MEIVTKMVEKHRRIHFIGIGGSGMMPLAEIALEKGFSVSGSDINISESISKLEKRGAKIFSSHTESHLSNFPTTVVFSSAINPKNPEFKKAQKEPYRLIHRSDLLKDFMASKKAITIAGTHGKTTTTAIVNHMLNELGASPSTYIGGQLLPDRFSGKSGDGPLFVAELDESDGTFLKFSPFISVITGIGPDHLDHYQTLENIESHFEEYLGNTDPDGKAVLFWENKTLRELAHRRDRSFLSYGASIGCDIRLLDATPIGAKVKFRAIVEKDTVEGVTN